MSKANKVTKDANFTFEPWSCRREGALWMIEAYSLALGKRQVVAEIHPDSGFSTERLANFIINAVNIIEKRECLINEMVSALEICLESQDGKLDWSAEHDAEVALRHAKDGRTKP